MDNPDDLLGTVIDGRYRLAEYIGSGSFGSVFAADELTLGRVISRVAVKLITPEHPDHRQAVLNEIVGLARLHHDYIITYRSSGEVAYGDLAGTIFLATELGDTTLAKRLKADGRVGGAELREVVRGVALALAHVHAQGVIHGDVKPANVIRVKGRWKLGDMGLIRSTRSKRSGPFHGSLTYIAPEMLRGEFSPANDVYALGVTMLFALTGRYAHAGVSRDQFTNNLRVLPPTIPDGLEEPWRGLIAHCLQLDPDRRPTAEQVVEHLRPGAPPLPPPPPAPVTVTVAADGHGDYPTIQAAIDACPPDARIIVRPGRYREPLRIDKPLELIADGSPDQVVVSTRDARCLELTSAGRVKVKGFTLRCRPTEGGAETFAVDVAAGRPILEECVIRSIAVACVAVHDGADPDVRRCTVHGSQDAGVFVFDQGRGTFTGCRIAGNGTAGVTIGEGGSATFRECQIAGNRGGGVFVFAGGAGKFDDCQITGNAKVGVAVGAGGRGELKRCKVTDNAGEGVLLQGGAAAEVHGCDLRGNKKGPWRVADGSQLTASGNRE